MKRKIRGKAISIISAILLISILSYKIPHFLNIKKLQHLGYNAEAINAIYQKGLKKQILKNNYYSDFLNQEIIKDNFKKEYLRLYVVNDKLNDKYFSLYERLKELKEYNDEELITLYSKLDYEKLTALLVFDKVDINNFLNDISDNVFLSKDNKYLNAYENIIEIDDIENIETFVSKKAYINDYVPLKLVDIPNMDAIPGLKLESRALDAFSKLCKALRENDTPIYAISAYYSYEDQLNSYNNYDKKEDADNNMTRPGYNDDQLGLSVSVVASENESVANFHLTKAYEWLLKHSYEYGFILRYPLDKEYITGEKGRTNYFRYVGNDLALKIYQSNLTFDEYYMLYIYKK